MLWHKQSIMGLSILVCQQHLSNATLKIGNPNGFSKGQSKPSRLHSGVTTPMGLPAQHLLHKSIFPNAFAP
jgi:hypothetical protein